MYPDSCHPGEWVNSILVLMKEKIPVTWSYFKMSSVTQKTLNETHILKNVDLCLFSCNLTGNTELYTEIDRIQASGGKGVRMGLCF